MMTQAGFSLRRAAPLLLAVALLPVFTPLAAQRQSSPQFRRLPVAVYRQKMMAGWLGQMVGVSFGAPTEFRYVGRMIPDQDVPELHPGLANEAFSQDDLYVEMTFLKSLETYGLDVSAAQAGIDFANSEYELWHANKAARDNLRRGIAPPDSGHPQFSGFSDDIDYQIEADFAGLISPGMPNNAIRLGEKFGTLMNYGDGLYGGQFVSCLYSEAFFEDDPEKLVETALSCIPPQSQYAEVIRDVLQWWHENPDDWQKTWQQVNDKYQRNPAYRRYSSGDDYVKDPAFDIDAKLNGAFVVMGLLYGERDPVRTMVTAMQSGQDSDCNPSSAGGVLFTTIGYDRLPALFTAGLDTAQKFSYTDYNFPQLIAVSEALAREAILKAGGSIETGANGEEVFAIPVQQPEPSPFVQSWEPGPITGSLFTEQQAAQIRSFTGGLNLGIETFAPGWEVAECSADASLGLKAELQGHKGVLVTSPVSDAVPCRLTRTVSLPRDSVPMLRLVVGHFPGGSWDLVVRANGEQLVRRTVGQDTAPEGWLQVDIDLSAYAGQTTRLDLLHQSNGSRLEVGYWDSIELTGP
jgi:hypothetical protein